MPFNLTHNRFGDYTPIARTPSKFRRPRKNFRTNLRLGLDELEDRPHFGVVDVRTREAVLEAAHTLAQMRF